MHELCIMSLNNLHVVLLFHTGKGNYCITTKLGGSLLLLFLLWFLYHFELLVPNASFIGSKSPKRWFSRTHTHHLSPGLSSESPFCFVLICPLGPLGFNLDSFLGKKLRPHNSSFLSQCLLFFCTLKFGLF